MSLCNTTYLSEKVVTLLFDTRLPAPVARMVAGWAARPSADPGVLAEIATCAADANDCAESLLAGAFAHGDPITYLVSGSRSTNVLTSAAMWRRGFSFRYHQGRHPMFALLGNVGDLYECRSCGHRTELSYAKVLYMDEHNCGTANEPWLDCSGSEFTSRCDCACCQVRRTRFSLALGHSAWPLA